MVAEFSAEWKPGFESLHKANAQLVAQEIISIGESATPAQIVDKARDAETELHKCFEWDDAKAAEAHRLQQARQVTCHLVIRETIREDKPPIRFFFKPDNGAGYQPTTVIVRNQDNYQNLLASAMRDLDALRRKYHTLSELEQVFDAIEELMRGVPPFYHTAAHFSSFVALSAARVRFVDGGAISEPMKTPFSFCCGYGILESLSERLSQYDSCLLRLER